MGSLILFCVYIRLRNQLSRISQRWANKSDLVSLNHRWRHKSIECKTCFITIHCVCWTWSYYHPLCVKHDDLQQHLIVVVCFFILGWAPAASCPLVRGQYRLEIGPFSDGPCIHTMYTWKPSSKAMRNRSIWRCWLHRGLCLDLGLSLWFLFFFPNEHAFQPVPVV